MGQLCSSLEGILTPVWDSFSHSEPEKTQESQFKVWFIVTRVLEQFTKEEKIREDAERSDLRQKKAWSSEVYPVPGQGRELHRKYRTFLMYASKTERSKVDVEFYSSTKAGLVFPKSASDLILKRDTMQIKNAVMHSIILNSTKDRDDLVAVLVRCGDEKGIIQSVFETLHVSPTPSISLSLTLSWNCTARRCGLVSGRLLGFWWVPHHEEGGNQVPNRGWSKPHFCHCRAICGNLWNFAKKLKMLLGRPIPCSIVAARNG